MSGFYHARSRASHEDAALKALRSFLCQNQTCPFRSGTVSFIVGSFVVRIGCTNSAGH